METSPPHILGETAQVPKTAARQRCCVIRMPRQFKKIHEGNFKPGVAYYGLKEGGVSLTEMKYTKGIISGDVLSKIRDIENKIKSGEIKMTNAMIKK